MSFHFAYPNVLPKKRKFLGCGRYTVAMPETPPADDYEIVSDAPVTPNRNSLKRAVQLLTPESFDSKKVLFHRQDQNEIRYQGDSLDLAWFLAHMLRAYQLRCRPAHDIWATGVIQVDSSGPHLLDVDASGFMLKLKAFLDDNNTDMLFIVPLANILPHIRRMCEENNAVIHRLGSEEACKVTNLKKKTILAVPADGLHRLLKVLFCLPVENQSRKKNRFLFVLFMLLLVGLGGFAGRPHIIRWLQDARVVEHFPHPSLLPISLPVPEPEQGHTNSQISVRELLASLQQGDFSAIPDLSEEKFWQASDKLIALRQRLLQPLRVQGELVYVLGNGTKNTLVFPALGKPPVLTHRDHYRIQVNTVMPSDSLYLYLFQVDSSGSLTVIFPNHHFGTSNPVRPWQWPLVIPQQNDQWIFLDKLPAKSRHNMREILYLLLSPWPARDIEQLCRDLMKNPKDEAIKAQILSRMSLRKNSFPAMAYIRWNFLHGK